MSDMEGEDQPLLEHQGREHYEQAENIDIVERLRGLAYEHHEMLDNIDLPLTEAADEIERLRAALREIASHPWPYHPVTGIKLRDMAREALGEDD